MQQRPTKKQRELLSFIDGFIKGNGYGPSYREIMRALDYKSVSTVATHINGLITRGWLAKKNNSARTLEVVYQSTVPPAQKPGGESAELVITNKIDELRSLTAGDHSHEIETLTETLQILGYSQAHKKYLV